MKALGGLVKENIARGQDDLVRITVKVFNVNRPRLRVLGGINV